MLIIHGTVIDRRKNNLDPDAVKRVHDPVLPL